MLASLMLVFCLASCEKEFKAPDYEDINMSSLANLDGVTESDKETDYVKLTICIQWHIREIADTATLYFTRIILYYLARPSLILVKWNKYKIVLYLLGNIGKLEY